MGGRTPKTEAPEAPPPRRRELRFVLGFALLAGAFEFVFLGWVDQTAWFERYLALNATWTAGLLKAGGWLARSNGSTLYLETSVIAVRRGCDAIEPFALFAIATLLFPASRKRKIVGLVIAAFGLQALNLLRIATLLLAHRYQPEHFATLHLSVWPTGVFLATLVGWILWALGTMPRRAAAGPGVVTPTAPGAGAP